MRVLTMTNDDASRIEAVAARADHLADELKERHWRSNSEAEKFVLEQLINECHRTRMRAIDKLQQLADAADVETGTVRRAQLRAIEVAPADLERAVERAGGATREDAFEIPAFLKLAR